jgi:DNA-binding PucR family transcriptional regulator
VEAALAGQRAVVGPTVAWQQAHHSISRAVSAWPLHARGGLGGEPLARTEEHLLALLLAADPALVRDLAARRLRPLHRLPDGARERAEATLRAWFDAHGDVSATAERLHLHPQTVRYRLAGLRDVFGRALDDPVTRLETELALRSGSQPLEGDGDRHGGLGLAAPRRQRQPGDL